MSISKTNRSRIIIFAHYDINDVIDDYVLFYLKYLKSYCEYLIFVSTSNLDKKDIQKLYLYCDNVIVKENIGYDFVSWKTGIESITNLSKYDELIICNDSVYGPLFSLKNVFKKMDSIDCDFWGITDNSQFAYHLQSYFLVFRKNVFMSKIFQNFWNTVQVLSNKNEIIFNYEIGLSTQLIKNGFIPGVFFFENIKFKILCLYKYFSDKKYRVDRYKYKYLVKYIFNDDLHNKSLGLNKLHHFWKELLSQRVPFIKIELLRDNPNNINLSGVEKILRKKTNYHLGFIKSHLKRIKSQ